MHHLNNIIAAFHMSAQFLEKKKNDRLMFKLLHNSHSMFHQYDRLNFEIKLATII